MRRVIEGALLVAAALILALAAAAPSSAQETEVEFVEEVSGLPCSPCVAEGEGESHITALPAGVVISTCHDVLTSVIYHDGSGESEWLGSSHGSPGCNFTTCQTGDEAHPPIEDVGELGGGTGHLTVTFCLRSVTTGAELHCSKEVVGHATGSHEGDYTFNALCSGGARRVEGVGFGLTSDVEAIHHSE